MAVVYRHIRLDKNEPFYIGIGLTKYRAGKKTLRNSIWHKITAKTDFEVEILFDNVSVEFAKEKEKEFISLYGRINKRNGGILANMTDGGDGISGYVFNDKDKLKMSESALGKKMSESAKKKMGDNQKLPVLQYDLDGNFIKEWDGTIDAIKFIGGHSTNIMRCCQGKFKQAYGFIWKYKNPEKMGRRIKNQQNQDLKSRLDKAGL